MTRWVLFYFTNPKAELLEAQMRLEELEEGDGGGSGVDTAYYDNLLNTNRRKWEQSEQEEIRQVQRAAQDTYEEMLLEQNAELERKYRAEISALQ